MVEFLGINRSWTCQGISLRVKEEFLYLIPPTTKDAQLSKGNYFRSNMIALENSPEVHLSTEVWKAGFAAYVG